ncbi:MAG TPA: CAP domain-containing protein [Solirubrobacteraceae bacterium]|jgi:uncharacterized protein YkwD|nr:CAP domain-containing protein [Solirubrobacteraceae bacterium]
MRRLVAAVVSAALVAAPSPAGMVLRLINQARTRAHLARLHADGRLAHIARVCREDVLRSCSRRLGVHVRALGENTALYITQGPREAVEAWMESPSHRANILEPDWRATGVAVLGTTYVQVFGP